MLETPPAAHSGNALYALHNTFHFSLIPHSGNALCAFHNTFDFSSQTSSIHFFQI